MRTFIIENHHGSYRVVNEFDNISRAKRALLKMFNKEFDTDFPNWGMAVIHSDYASGSTSFDNHNGSVFFIADEDDDLYYYYGIEI